jgi:hypothetical protein
LKFDFYAGNMTLARKLDAAVHARGVKSAAQEREQLQHELRAEAKRPPECVECGVRKCTFEFSLCGHQCVCGTCKKDLVAHHIKRGQEAWEAVLSLRKPGKVPCPICRHRHSEQEIVRVAN